MKWATVPAVRLCVAFLLSTLLTAVLVISRPGMAGASSSDIRAIVDNEVQKLNDATGLNVRVIYRSGGGSETHTAGEITVDEQQLSQIGTKSGVTEMRDVIRLVLAHEIAHQLQFRAYGVASVMPANSTDYEKRRLYEAQADFLGAEYLMQTLDLQGQDLAASQKAILDALQVMFDLGVQVDGTFGIHPTQLERFEAVRLGMAAGQMVVMAKVAQQTHSMQFAESAELLAQKLGAESGDDALGFALRLSKKVQHYRLDGVGDLKMTGSSIHWNTAADNPVVDYDYTFKNKGGGSHKYELDVQCLSVPRTDTGDLKHSLLWSANHYHFALEPGSSHTVSGRLEWHATDTLQPRLLVVPAAGSMIAADD